MRIFPLGRNELCSDFGLLFKPGLQKAILPQHYNIITTLFLVFHVSAAATNDYPHYQLVCWLFSPLISWSKDLSTHQKINSHPSFSESKVMASEVLFCVANSFKPTVIDKI